MLLQEAHRGDGRFTVTQAVMASREDWEHVEACLQEMVQAGYVDVDNEPHSGVHRLRLPRTRRPAGFIGLRLISLTD